MSPAWEAAIRDGDVAALERLAVAGEDIDQRDRHGQSGLMLAVLDDREEAVAWLIGHGADLDHTAKWHLSALMLAAINGRTAIARRLIAAGADRTLTGSGAPGFAGRSALDIALENGHDEIAVLLARAG